MEGRFGAVILAGGSSSRMNYPKPFLITNGKSLLQHCTEAYRQAGIQHIVVVLNRELFGGEWKKFIEPLTGNMIFIRNDKPEEGRFYSVRLGCREMETMDFCFIHNIDNPLTGKEVIEKLVNAKNSWGYTLPVFRGRRGHPVLISSRIIRAINALDQNEINLRELLAKFPRREVETDTDDILLNINTREEFNVFVNKSL